MDLRQVVDHCAHLLIAGHETTEQTLLWTLYLLSQHRAQEAKLHGELDSVLAGTAPGVDDLSRLPYTRMVIEETMRLYPPVHTLVRRALVDDELPGGQRVRKDSQLFIMPFVIHRHCQLWNQPDVFDPERFAANRTGARHDFAYLPFGGGPRICMGASLAMMEVALILADIGQHYRLRLVPGQRIEPFGAVSLRPSKRMMMIVEPRRAPGKC
jgi:cytochrome P450